MKLSFLRRAPPAVPALPLLPPPLPAAGRELLEIRTVNQSMHAVQTPEKENGFNDPEKPVYTGTTSVETSLQTHYLFRKAN